MVHIKQYRVVGVNYKGEPYDMVQDFLRCQGANKQGSFIEDVGYPMNVAQSLVDRWNSTVELYRRQDPEYLGPTYSLVIPEPVSVRPVSVDDSIESEEVAFELVKYGQWTLTDFSAWMANVVCRAHDDGRKDALSNLQWRE